MTERVHEAAADVKLPAAQHHAAGIVDVVEGFLLITFTALLLMVGGMAVGIWALGQLLEVLR